MIGQFLRTASKTQKFFFRLTLVPMFQQDLCAVSKENENTNEELSLQTKAPLS